MNRFRTVLVFAICLVVAGSLGGCKKSPRSGNDLLDPGSLTGIDPNDPYSIGLGEGDRGNMSPYGESQFTPVYFAYDSSHVQPESQVTIEQVADYLRANPNRGVIVEGHCDERGSREYNLALSERRALAIRAYLVGLGIDASRVQTKSMGEESAVAFGHDEESWKLNRRGEFILFE